MTLAKRENIYIAISVVFFVAFFVQLFRLVRLGLFSKMDQSPLILELVILATIFVILAIFLRLLTNLSADESDDKTMATVKMTEEEYESMMKESFLSRRMRYPGEPRGGEINTGSEVRDWIFEQNLNRYYSEDS